MSVLYGQVAAADGGERAVKMGFDGGNGEAGDGGDLGKIELLDEAQEKDAALPFGKEADRFPDERELLVSDKRGLGGAGWVRQVGGEILGFDGRFERRGARTGNARCGCDRGAG